ncbi:MAG: carboxypeptidase regulatory-like domain-containing protein, partial [Blastocatellia bacterium]
MTNRSRAGTKGLAVLSVLVLCLLATVTAFGQAETGQLTIKVTDTSGAVVVGATITAKSVTTGAARAATTRDDGLAIITNLQPGQYDVTVDSKGFASQTKHAELTVGARLEIDIAMGAQAIQEAVTVVAGQGGIEVNTQSQELSTVVSSKELTELPSLTRNPYDFVALSGNVHSDSMGATSANGVGFSINGQRSASTDILLDGGENVDLFGASVGQSVPLESVQEFRILTNDFTAEYGRASGGIVNLTTKSGGNSFHGSLYEFNRVSALASNGFVNNANGTP